MELKTNVPVEEMFVHFALVPLLKLEIVLIMF